MPEMTERRQRLVQVAVALLAQAGVHGLTHRAVERAAGFPPGSTVHYFPSRAALLQAAAHQLLAHARADLPPVTPEGQGDLVGVLAEVVEYAEGPARTHWLARAELTLEATRSPEVASVLRQLRAATLRRLAARIRVVHPQASDAQIDTLGSLLTGLIYDRLTLGTPATGPHTLLGAITTARLAPDEGDRPRAGEARNA